MADDFRREAVALEGGVLHSEMLLGTVFRRQSVNVTMPLKDMAPVPNDKWRIIFVHRHVLNWANLQG